jgi:2-keto-4-pentenoate hydratase/2-oxohepta-3-ene-1,7-dioic acid hydratase in catechol pathway
MKICRFEYREEIYKGILEEEKVYLFENDQKSLESIDISEIKLLPPVVPSKIVCVGRNYAAHAAELGNEVPKEPLLFLKAPSAVITDGYAIEIPSQTNQVEHEGELAAVIGRICKNLSDTENVSEYIAGYTILNDVTARDVQRRDVQFTRGKSFDTFCPIANFIGTELDVSDIRVTTSVNGIIKQDGRTSQMVFSVDFLVKYISRQMTLIPGDVIATGTPSGVSRLEAGDICEVEIEGIGKLTNPVRKAF